MFTANSMNCLTEALGLALPGNGTIVATHADREQLFLRAGRLIVELAKRHYEQDDYSVLPRSIATKAAFENAMALDVSMGGSTNTVLHLLAAAHEAEVDFTMADIDRISRKVPCLCKVAPMTDKYHIEDVHRAGGIVAILGELARAGLLDTSLPTIHAPTLGDAIERNDIKRSDDPAVHKLFRAAPGGVPTQVAFSQSERYDALDTDRSTGCIRDKAHAYSQDGGLAVLYGNLAEKGCIVKTAGVDESILKFSGKARVFESQDAAVEAILGDTVHEGDVVIIPLRRSEGRAGHAGDAVSDFVHQVQGSGQGVRAVHRWPFLGRFVGPGDRPRFAGSGGGRRHRPGGRGRHDRHRHPEPHHQPARQRCRSGGAPRRDGSQGRGDAWQPVNRRALCVAGAASLRGADHLGRPWRRARSVADQALRSAVIPAQAGIHAEHPCLALYGFPLSRE